MESLTDIEKNTVLNIFNYNLEEGEYKFPSFDDLLSKGEELKQEKILEQHINKIVNHFKTASSNNVMSFMDKYHDTDLFIKKFRGKVSINQRNKKSKSNGGGKKRPRSIKRGKPKKGTSKKKKRTNGKR